MKNKKIGTILGIVCGIFALAVIIFAAVLINMKESIPGELDRGHDITGPGYIMLTAETTNITIVAPGNYTLTGKNENEISVIVDSKDVTLTLQDAKINTGKNAGIINLSEEDLTVEIATGTTNMIFGGNPNQYNAPIYSRGDINFVGEGGTLVLGNRRSKSPMILTEGDKKASISGGTLVGLNAEKLAENLDSSQGMLSFSSNWKIRRGDNVMVSDEEGEVVCDFETDADIESLIVSAKSLKTGTYTLFDDKKVAAVEEFE